MGPEMKFICSVALLLVMTQVSGASGGGMTCDTGLGISINCPLPFQSEDKVFCCYQNNNTPYCCDLGDYFVNHTAIIGGVIAALVILLLAITLCCCCCCSCCLLAKRRQQRGTVLYGPVATTHPIATMSYPAQPSTYTQSHYQQASVVHTPPPYSASQPPFNPTFQQNS